MKTTSGSEEKTQAFLSYLKSRMTNKQTIGPLKDDDQTIYDNMRMANTIFSMPSSYPCHQRE